MTPLRTSVRYWGRDGRQAAEGHDFDLQARQTAAHARPRLGVQGAPPRTANREGGGEGKGKPEQTDQKRAEGSSPSTQAGQRSRFPGERATLPAPGCGRLSPSPCSSFFSLRCLRSSCSSSSSSSAGTSSMTTRWSGTRAAGAPHGGRPGTSHPSTLTRGAIGRRRGPAPPQGGAGCGACALPPLRRRAGSWASAAENAPGEGSCPAAKPRARRLALRETHGDDVKRAFAPAPSCTLKLCLVLVPCAKPY